MCLAHKPRDRGGEVHGGRRVARLTALHENGRLPFFDPVVVFDINFEGATGNPAADHRAMAGINGNFSQRKKALLEGGFLNDLGFDAQVFHPVFIEDDGFAWACGCGEEGSGKEEKDRFHGLVLFSPRAPSHSL